MRLMRSVPGRCFVASLVVLSLGGCTGARPADGPAAPSPTAATRPTTVTPSTVAAATTRTTRDNAATTRRFSAWLLHAVPMPPSAREWRHSPTVHYRQGTLGIGPSDARFTRTTWWTVRLSGEAFGAWLRTHAPRRLRADLDSGGPSESQGVWEQDRDFRAASTEAHTEGWVNFASTPYGDGLVVRVDTFVGARFARTALVPTDATSVRISRTERSLRPHARRRTTVRTVTRPGAVARLVDLVNGLPGAMTGRFVASCPAIVTVQRYSMRFATPDGSYVATLPDTACWPSVTLRHDGVRTGPPLDPDRRFPEIADRYLGRAPRR